MSYDMDNFDWDDYAEDIIERAFLTNNFKLIEDTLGADVLEDIAKQIMGE